MHKAVMCARSKFFYKAMTTDMKEKRDGVIQLPEAIKLVRCLIEFCYTGNYKYEDKGRSVAALLHHVNMNAMADKYDVAGLSDIAGENWQKNVTKIASDIYHMKAEEQLKEWRQMILLIYETTTKRDNPLRRAVSYTTRHWDLATTKPDREEWYEMMSKMPDFGVDYMLP